VGPKATKPEININTKQQWQWQQKQQAASCIDHKKQKENRETSSRIQFPITKK